MSIPWNTANSAPSRDGHVTQYIDGAAQQVRSHRSRQLVWVNGMQNSAEDHRGAGQRLSSIVEGVSFGVYNQCGTPTSLPTIAEWLAAQRRAVAPITGPERTYRPVDHGSGVLATLTETAANIQGTLATGAANLASAADRSVRVPALQQLLGGFESVARGMGSAQSVVMDLAQCGRDWCNVWVTLMASAPMRAIATQFPETVKDFIMSYFAYNPPVASLVAFLTERRWQTGTCIIVAHSQGNLIVSCALHALKALTMATGRGINPNGSTVVFSVASPSPNWPTGIARIRSYTNPGDGVTWLSLGRSYGVRPEAVAGNAVVSGAVSGVAGRPVVLSPFDTRSQGPVTTEYTGLLTHGFNDYLGTNRLIPDLLEAIGHGR